MYAMYAMYAMSLPLQLDSQYLGTCDARSSQRYLQTTNCDWQLSTMKTMGSPDANGFS